MIHDGITFLLIALCGGLLAITGVVIYETEAGRPIVTQHAR
jgi:hypothetical protein